MPSVAQESPSVLSSKKRRRDDNSQHLSFPFNAGGSPRGTHSDRQLFDHGSLSHHQSSPLAARKLIPLPAGKRQRTTVDIEVGSDRDLLQRSPSNSPSQRHYHQAQRQPRQHQTKDGYVQESHNDNEPRSAANPPVSSLMNRCHICSRKPNKKSDLDSFADCQGCGQRTCYVCIRECLGWDPSALQQQAASAATRETAFDMHRPAAAAAGNLAAPTTTTPVTTPADEEGETSFTILDADAEDHHHHHRQQPSPGTRGTGQEHGWTRGGGHRQVVCSRCCVEKGQDGDVVCLGCLPFVEG